jgi:ABC-type branched-subunit amino acid transport system ATPase component
MLELKNVEANIAEKQVLRGVSIKVSQGAVVAVLVANGVDKFSLIRVITGSLKATGGHPAYFCLFKDGTLLEVETHRESRRQSAIYEKIGRGKFHTKLLTVPPFPIATEYPLKHKS